MISTAKLLFGCWLRRPSGSEWPPPPAGHDVCHLRMIALGHLFPSTNSPLGLIVDLTLKGTVAQQWDEKCFESCKWLPNMRGSQEPEYLDDLFHGLNPGVLTRVQCVLLLLYFHSRAETY